MKVIVQSLFLGMGLAMDASAVSMTNGMKFPKMTIKKTLLIAFMFGLFQGLMPMLGYFLGSAFTKFSTQFTPWIALGLLSIIGGKMLYEGIKHNSKDDDEEVESLTFKVLLIQAIATAIDALSVGVILIDYKIHEMLIAVAIIALVTFIFSLSSVFLGKKFGTLLKSKAEIIGGLILIGIGLEIFISGVFF